MLNTSAVNGVVTIERYSRIATGNLLFNKVLVLLTALLCSPRASFRYTRQRELLFLKERQ